MESTDSSSGTQHPQLPPGFRFHPTDEELVVHYLKRKVASAPLPVAIIAEVDLYKFDPWELPGKATFGEHEWYFFSPRDRKYPNGARPNRAATSGYWKATGTDKPIVTSGGGQKVGVKKALVFYGGKPPKGTKTNWIMHEYRLVENSSISKPPGSEFSSKKGTLRLDDWVLCRIYKKHNSQRPMERETEDSVERNGVFPSSIVPPSCHQSKPPLASKATGYNSFLESDQETFFEGLLAQGGVNAIQNSPISHLPSTSCSKPNISLSSMDTPTGSLAVKRPISSQSYWEGGGASSLGEQPPGGKRFHGDLNSNTGSNGGDPHDQYHHHPENSSSFVSLLNHNPHQGSPFHSNSFLGSIGDGVLRQQYQLSGINWGS